MRKTNSVFLALSISFFAWAGHAQTNPSPQLRVVVGPASSGSDSVIAVPPATSWRGTIAIDGKNSKEKIDPRQLAAWLDKQSAVNGLQSKDLHPWHIVIAYDEFDGDGDNVHSGVFEEIWAGPTHYRASYKADNLNQTDYATDHGLFRLGDQRWPNRAEIEVRDEIIDPFGYARTLEDYRITNSEQNFGAHSLDCANFVRAQGMNSPTEYCFDPGGAALRYTRGQYWNQTAYNDVSVFQGRNVARAVVVTDGGKPYLKLTVTTLAEISNVDEKQLTPPAEAVNVSGLPVSGVAVIPVKMISPEWPSDPKRQKFTVKLDIVIGKDGHVKTAHAVSGPVEAYKIAEDGVKKWVFRPYLVLGQPVEVEWHAQLSNN